MENKENYIKANCTINPYSHDFSDLLCNYLAEHGFESFVETEDGVDAYILESKFNNDVRKIIETHDYDFFKVFYSSFETIISQNWNEEWEKNYFEPLHIGELCVVRAPFHHSFPNVKYEIVIEPKMAFGTGNHETTFLMMLQMLNLDFTNKKVLDMGCGTGVLAILASKLGACEITAIDYDVWSYESSIENASNNNCKNIIAKHGDALLLKDEKEENRYNIVLANIHRNVLLSDIKYYKEIMDNDALLLMSGFYTHDLEDIKKEAALHGLTYLSHQVKKDWTMAVFKLNA